MLSASWHPCYKFRTWHMLKNPIRKAFTAFSLCFNYDRAAGNKSANKHFVTWQFSVGWHQGLPGPAWDQCSTSIYQGKKWIMLRNGNRKTRELKTALLFQSGHPFLWFFTAVSFSSCSWNGWWFLASLSWTFTASPHITSFSLRRQHLLGCWNDWWCLTPLSAVTFWSWILYFLLPHSNLWENSDNHKVSTLGVVNAYTFSWTASSPK